MKNKIVLNSVFNLFVAIIFVYLHTQALRQGLEETHISLAIMYGLVTIIGNAIFIKRF